MSVAVTLPLNRAPAPPGTPIRWAKLYSLRRASGGSSARVRHRRLRSGDIVWFPPGLKRWHGATPGTAMTHIAIHEFLDGKAVDWLEHVSEEQ